MRALAVLAVFAITVFQNSSDAVLAQGEQHQFVSTQEGQVLGAVQAGIVSFKGIPYAAPPVGRWRWRAPRPADNRPEILVADKYGPPCLQPSIPGGENQESSSEDCLTINIFRPFEVDDRLPVMVWIHGESLAIEAGGNDFYDGSRLAREGVIVVTFNYRLGALGWFAHPALGKDAEDATVANYGMMDQIAALRWIRDNIGAFGGDSGNVTLFGASAGGTSVMMLMISDNSAGLFQKAIIESGWGREPARALRDAEAGGKEVARALGVEADAAALRDISAERLVSAAKPLRGKPPVEGFHIRDGKLVKENIADAFKVGHERHIPIIIGTSSDEATLFPAIRSKPEEELKRAADPIESLQKSYPEGSGDPQELAARLFTDRVFTEPARLVARTHAAHGSPTYRYLFSYRPEQQRQTGGAGDGHEIQFVFGTLGVRGGGLFTYKDREMSNILRAYWTNFAKTGNPNGAGLPQWEAYSANDKLLLISNNAIVSQADPWAERLDRLERQSEGR